ncbi:rhomboid family intramembrane serine protease [Bailinhaonella thermotolerans]|uniref:Rhomboid family intramembrane serine protease n=1 Tax=Bailinhaonella thermotolerans TaxID=1070861 RepID=A0A3A4AP57_9ACTN|nr:rhomboid family intramembrane serine protease [Bailinhaonella thermotolerans]RJL30801.1 rhomboid family intramembrane serine protease [Bailinhaonella thermotolerans]
MGYVTPPAGRRPSSPVTRGAASALRVGVLLVSLVAALWAIEIVDFVLGNPLDAYGIRPYTTDGLIGIFLAPFLHLGFEHLIANSWPLLVLGFMAALRGVGRFLGASLVIIMVSGIGVWFTSPPNSVTIGASGLVFGYFGFLLARGVFDRRTLDIALAIVVVLLYGGIIWGVLPTQEGVSWQGHLFGLLGGVLAGWVFRRPRARPAPYPTGPSPYS